MSIPASSGMSGDAFLDYPLSPPPLGQSPNFTNPPSRASQIYISAGICLPLMLFFGALRIYAKVVLLGKRKSWDDLTCTLGLLSGFSFISLTIAAVAGGAYGFHQWDITIRDFTKEQLMARLPMLNVLRWLKVMAITGMIVTGMFYVATMITFAVLCSPKNGHTQLAYLTALASDNCSSSRPVITATGIVNIISDLFLVALPLPAVWNLHLTRRKKLGVSAMFLTGFVACTASIVGLVYRVIVVRNTDNTWVVIPVWTTTIVEMTAGVLVCCMPTTAAVFSTWRLPSIISRTRYAFKSSFRSSAQRDKTSSSSELHNMDSGRLAPARPNEWRSEDWPYSHPPSDEAGENGIRKTESVEVAFHPVNR
ncbi:hypothetical protein DSL72_002558 [Monilinia vaccinii-corymbosi]|uniref:Rhodopsin domain-containing protein n=1 Tax=Monilinia vaccinii-corymbosi TaxID=61207 RepID=A0A8A3PD02_9HELO|nr:hypothetical protein DSL72_002558 [Monilinia vaccinii-corymbosi]